MPHLVVKLVPGRTEELKARLAAHLVREVVAVLQCDEAAVSLAIEEVGAADWAVRVFRPEILDNPNLYKRPGYNPLA